VDEAGEMAVEEGVKAFQAIAARAERAVGSSRSPSLRWQTVGPRSGPRSARPCPIQVIITHPALLGQPHAQQ